MAGMRTPPRARARLRPGLAASWRGIGYLFGQSLHEIFGLGPDLTLLNGPSLERSRVGYGRKFNGTNQYATALPPSGVVDLTKPFTILLAVVLDGLATTRLVNFRDPATAHNVQVMFGASQRMCFIHAPNTSSIIPRVTSNDVLEAGRPYVICMRWDGSSYSMHINGVEQNGPAVGSVSVSGATPTISLGRRSDGSGSYLSGQMALFMYIACAVDNPVALSLNPWQIFTDAEDSDDVRAAGSNTAMSVDPAWLQLAGTAALKVSRRISAGAAPMSAAFGGAQLRVARRVLAAAASMAMKAGTAEFRNTPAPGEPVQSVSVGSAALAFGAGSVGMRVRRQLRIDAASYVLAGQAVGFGADVTGGPIDASTVPAARKVVFGGGKREVIFHGGVRVVEFSGGIRIVRF